MDILFYAKPKWYAVSYVKPISCISPIKIIQIKKKKDICSRGGGHYFSLEEKCKSVCVVKVQS